MEVRHIGELKIHVLCITVSFQSSQNDYLIKTMKHMNIYSIHLFHVKKVKI